MTAAIECVGLSKVYGGRVAALSDVSLSIASGASFALLGENGAGKSTFVRLLMGFLHPSAGYLRVLDETHVERAHDRIGYVHERPLFEPRFTGREYLTYAARLAGLWDAAPHARVHARVEAVLEQVGLVRAASRDTGEYSKGMLQRLSIAQALLTDPELLLLDEITSGLDPGSQYEVRQIIQALRRQGKTIFLCTHYLAEAEQLCDRVGILRRGKLAAFGAVSELLSTGDAVEIVLAGDESAPDVVARCNLKSVVREVQSDRFRVPATAQQSTLSALVHADVRIQSLNPIGESLEDVYVRITRTLPQPPGDSVSITSDVAEGGQP